MKITRATFPCVQCHATFVYDGHLRGPVAFTSIAERLCIAFVTTCFMNLVLSRRDFRVQYLFSELFAIKHMYTKSLEYV